MELRLDSRYMGYMMEPGYNSLLLVLCIQATCSEG